MQSKAMHIYEVRTEQEVDDIKRKLSTIDGVEKVHGDYETKIFAVQWSAPTTWDQIADKLHLMGYEPAYK